MSRSGYSDEAEDVGLWRGAVASALRGRRGQAFLRELLSALDALPLPRLVREDLVRAQEYEVIGGAEYCALGAVGRRRGTDLTKVDPYNNLEVAETFDVAHALACEVMWVNDNSKLAYYRQVTLSDGKLWHLRRDETPEERFARVRAWVVSNLREPA